jgi:predicted nucleic acid-binding protein
VFVYAFDPGEPDKRHRAIDTLASLSGAVVLSTQVLAEFYVAVTRKLARPLPQPEAASRVRELTKLELVATDASLVTAAIELSQHAQLSYWDAAIVAAAARSGCARLLTEDLQHGSLLSGVRVENPFA